MNQKERKRRRKGWTRWLSYTNTSSRPEQKIDGPENISIVFLIAKQGCVEELMNTDGYVAYCSS